MKQALPVVVSLHQGWRGATVSEANMNQIPFEQLTHARFSALVKTPFRVRVEGGASVELKLAVAQKLGPKSESAEKKGESFSLIFEGPVSRLLAQRIYDFEHDGLGAFSLFIVPVGKTADAYQYEAVINRLG